MKILYVLVAFLAIWAIGMAAVTAFGLVPGLIIEGFVGLPLATVAWIKALD